MPFEVLPHLCAHCGANELQFLALWDDDCVGQCGADFGCNACGLITEIEVNVIAVCYLPEGVVSDDSQ
jgi:hypothetical protein